ncbi:hypothetical protein [Abyssogena phaseoliformis symbiont]|uniref:hypothetical protein n=1 Tax=Abyssogena phaseoliformis symbiont TaxID=596095 RepID=UPI00191581AE|nr:hypothetical protein [Abyssogena phaseoliformis symbiont]
MQEENENLAYENRIMAEFLVSLGIDKDNISDIINYELSGDLAVKRIVDMFYEVEKIHWEKSNEPIEHVFHSLRYLKNLVTKDTPIMKNKDLASNGGNYINSLVR